MSECQHEKCIRDGCDNCCYCDRPLRFSEVVTCQKCNPSSPHELVTSGQLNITINHQFVLGYEQGRKNAIDEVLALLKKECPYVQNGTALSEWLEGKLKGGG